MSKKPFAEKRDYLSIIGFLLVLLGILSLVLHLIGGRFSFLAFIDSWGALAGFVIRLLMVMVGFVMMYISRQEPLHE